MAEADEGIDLWWVGGDAGKAREASEREIPSVGRPARERESVLPVRAGGGGDGGVGVRGRHGSTGSDGRSLLRRDPRLARAESGNPGGDGAEERTPGRDGNGIGFRSRGERDPFPPVGFGSEEAAWIGEPDRTSTRLFGPTCR